MSPPAVAGSLVAAISADTVGLPKPDMRAAEKSTRPFSQTPALVNARQTTKADNVAVVSEPKGKLPTGDKSATMPTPFSEPVPANLPPARGEKAAAPGKMRGLEALMQAAGWDA